MIAKFWIVAASAALASAYTQPTTQCTDGCNPISKPSLQEAVPAGSPYTVTWQPTTSGTVTILLLRGPSENLAKLYPIVEATANTGTFTWTPSTDLEDDVTHYGLQLINDADGTYQWSTQFGISNQGKKGGSSSSAAVSASVSGSSHHTKASNGTESAAATTTAAAYSTGAAYNSSAVVSPTKSISKPATLETAAATTTQAAVTTTKAASTSAKPATGAAAQFGISLGSAVLAFAAAFYAL